MADKFLGVIPYTGNKQALLPALFKLFPKAGAYSRFVDAFCGGLSVALNVPCERVLANDYDWELIDVYRSLMAPEAFDEVKAIIAHHGLNATDKDAYMRFRDFYNNHDGDVEYLLYILMMHSFSNQKRTNAAGEFNMPFGFRTLNSMTEERFNHFQENKHKLRLSQSEFYKLNIYKDDFLYCDPPYLITEATYNKDWSEAMERLLYAWLDIQTERGIKWGLSNVTHHGGKQNDILIDWMQKYNVHALDKNYLLGQHQASFEKTETREVYVCNYEQPPFTLDDL